MKDKSKCKLCGIALCLWCDDRERRVCTFCMDPEHEKLWAQRVLEIKGDGSDYLAAHLP